MKSLSGENSTDVDFVFNEQKIRDAEISLYHLEQKVSRLEC